MRAPRVVALVAAATLALTLALTACSTAVRPPKGATSAEIDSMIRVELDRQWAFTGLEGTVPRPEVEVEEAGSVYGYSEGFWNCMSTAGFESWGFSSDLGLQLSAADGTTSRPTAQQQLDYYLCNARFPGIDTLTVDQLDFIYDYYARWLIPCLRHEGYSVSDPPSRERFTTEEAEFFYRWTPYSSLVERPATDAANLALTAKCAPSIPGIPGWE